MKLVFAVLLLLLPFSGSSQPFSDQASDLGLPTQTYWGGLLFFQSDVDSLDIIRMGSSGIGPTLRNLYSIENSHFSDLAPRFNLDFADTNFFINDQYFDLNNDGFTDIIGFFPKHKKGMMIFWGSSGGYTYENNTVIPENFSTIYNDPYRLSTVDFNLDGKLDLLSDNYGVGDFIDNNYYELKENNEYSKGDFWNYFQGVSEFDTARIDPFDDINHDGLIDFKLKRYYVSYRKNGNWSPLKGDLASILQSDQVITDLDSDGIINIMTKQNYFTESGHRYISLFEIVKDGNGYKSTKFFINGVESDILGTFPYFQDFNNDGLPDLYVTGGHDNLSGTIFLNSGKINGAFHFDQVQEDCFDTPPIPGSFSQGFVDINSDGLLDVIVMPSIFYPGRIQAFINENQEGNHFLKVILKQTKSRADLEGANIEIVSSELDKWSHQRYIFKNRTSFNQSRIPNFGLGKTEVLDTVKVIWPSGIIDILTGVKANQTIRIREGETHTSVENHAFPIAGSFRLEQNYPNPFNPETLIPFYLSNTSFVKITIYNQLGQKVSTPLNKKLGQGAHTIQINGSDLPSGLYIYKMEVNGRALSKKMILMK